MGYFVQVLLEMFRPSLLIILLCASYLSQCLYYRCCHTWSIINKSHYPCSSCSCLSYREEIVEEVYTEEEVVDTINTAQEDTDTLTTEC